MPPKAVFHRLIAENERANVALFELGPGAFIPAHNHPGMAVFSRLLFGRLQAVSFTRRSGLGVLCDRNVILDADNAGSPGAAAGTGDFAAAPGAAAGTAGGSLAAAMPLPGVTTLSALPVEGNIHAFRNAGSSPVVLLDIICPPYSIEDGRACTYFKIRPRSELLQSRLPSSQQLPSSLTAEALPFSALAGLEYSIKPLLDGPTDFETFERPYQGPAVQLPGPVHAAAGPAAAAAAAAGSSAAGDLSGMSAPEGAFQLR